MKTKEHQMAHVNSSLHHSMCFHQNVPKFLDIESVIQHYQHPQPARYKIFHMLFKSFDPTIDTRPATLLANFTVDINKLKEKLVLQRILQAQLPANIVDFTGI